jgi:CHAD domain-containing protein
LTRVRETFQPEPIHDLRVAARRLREGIALFAHCFRKKQFSRLRKELKFLTTMLGDIRNLDEAIRFFNPLTAAAPVPAAEIVGLVTRLQAHRLDEQGRVKAALKSLDPRTLLGRIDAACNNPLIFNPDAHGLLQPVTEYLLEAIMERGQPLLTLLPQAVCEENVAAQHRLRIAVKRFRYRLEFLAPLALDDYQQVYLVIKQYQEVLGLMHDQDVFSGMYSELTGVQPVENPIREIIVNRRRDHFADFLQLQSTIPMNGIVKRVSELI